MNENEMKDIFQNIDNDLIENEIDKLMSENNIDFDFDNIYSLAQKKLKKESIKMKKKKKYSILAVALIATLGTTVAYGNDIKEAVKSFFNKRTVYSTVVEGNSFYLKNAIELNSNNYLEKVIFTKDILKIVLKSDVLEENLNNINITTLSNKNVYEGSGYSMEGNNIYDIYFYNKTNETYEFFPEENISLNIKGNIFNINLNETDTIKQDDIKKADKKINIKDKDNYTLEGFDVGFRLLGEDHFSIQIITDFLDKDLKLFAIGKNKSTNYNYESFIDNENSKISTSNSYDIENIVAIDKEEKVYKLEADLSSSLRPICVFDSFINKEKIKEVIVNGLIVGYTKDIGELDFDIPQINEEVKIDKEIDFNLQKIKINSIRRTTENQVIIKFNNNILKNDMIKINRFIVNCSDSISEKINFNEEKGEIELNFENPIKESKIIFSYPSFNINNDWTLSL